MNDRPSESRFRISSGLWLILILALGAGLRLFRLSEIPPGDWYDEAINGLDGLRILRAPGWPLFFTTEGHPREPMFMYLVACMIALIGPTATALRAAGVLAGMATLGAVWLWSRETSGERRALLVVLAMSVMRWHLHFSRLSFRTNLAPLFIALLLWSGWKAARTRRPVWAGATGLFLGLGMATYLSFRMAPLILGATGLHALWLYKKNRKLSGGAASISPTVDQLTEGQSPIDQSRNEQFRNEQFSIDQSRNDRFPNGQSSTGESSTDKSAVVQFSPPESIREPMATGKTAACRSGISNRMMAAAFCLGLTIGGAPTLLDAVLHPEHLVGRATEVNPFSGGLSKGCGLIAGQARDVALTFFIRGDHVAKHNIPGSIHWAQLWGWTSPGVREAEEWWEVERAGRLGKPVIDPHGHGLPVFDPVAAIIFGIGICVLVRRFLRDTIAASVLFWMFFISLTSIFSYGAPNYLRMLGMTPAVAFTLVEGLEWSRKRVESRWGRRIASIFLVLFLMHFAILETKRYFIDWPRHPNTWTEFSCEPAQLARTIRQLPERAAVQVPDILRNHPTFVYETTDRKGIFGFGVKALEEIRKGGWEQTIVIAPLPPYPPAEAPGPWLNQFRPTENQILRRPDGVPWAVLLPGPAPIQTAE